jgi:hypothetical protein
MPRRSIHHPEYWWQRANEARAIANMVSDQEIKAELLKVAEIYDRLAKKAEERSGLRGKRGG